MILRNYLFFLFMFTFSCSVMGDQVALEWELGLVPGKEGARSVWLVDSGPKTKEAILINSDEMDELHSNIFDQVSDAVEKKMSWKKLRFRIITILKNKEFGDEEPRVLPKLRKPKSNENSKRITATIQIPRNTFDTVRLIFSGKTLNIKNNDAISLGEKVTLKPGFKGILLPPETFRDFIKTIERDFFIHADTKNNQKIWGENLSIQFALSDEEILKVAKARNLTLADAKKDLLRQLRTLAFLTTLQFSESKITSGMIYDVTIISEEVNRLILSSIGSEYAKTGKIETQKNGRLDVRVELFGLPKQVTLTALDGKLVDNALSKELQERYLSSGLKARSQLLTRSFRYPYEAAIKADLKYLQMDKGVLNDASGGKDEEEESIVFEVGKRPKLEKLHHLTSSLNISPEHDLTASLSMELVNVVSENNRLELSLEGGERSVDGKGEIIVDLQKSNGSRPDLGTRVFARVDINERKNAIYGNLTHKPVDDRQELAEIGLRWSYNSLTHQDRFDAEHLLQPKQFPNRVSGKFEVGLRYLSLDLEGEESDVLGLDTGESVGPYLTGYTLVKLNNNRFSTFQINNKILWENKIDFKTGFEKLGGDTDFSRLKLTSGIRVLPKQQQKRSPYFRHQWALGLTSHNTPTYQYFGAGERDFLRGLEKDEFIGRRYFALQNEVGVKLSSLWKPSSSQSANNEQAGNRSSKKKHQVGSPLDDLYISAFADFSWLDERVQDGASIDKRKAFQGYGILVNSTHWSLWKPPASFSVGYAYSPQSKQNESGVVFSQINYQF